MNNCVPLPPRGPKRVIFESDGSRNTTRVLWSERPTSRTSAAESVNAVMRFPVSFLEKSRPRRDDRTPRVLSW